MLNKLSTKQGEQLIKIARFQITKILTGKTQTIDSQSEQNQFLKEKGCLFVTLSKNNELRGCIGFIEPIYSIIDATKKASISAAFNDPRFPPLTKSELDQIKIEISYLSPFEKIIAKTKEELLSSITLGIDGILLKKGLSSALFLPQVATEWGFSKEEFLSNLCKKAGLPKLEWQNTKEIEFYKFQVQIFKE
ncbi:MAG TPA: AmmeMemoRadiSam system protein A [Candidatus Woesearchaeota archaeon]|nr:AmmeMemoRadiSam system protein A [Candidatus Woesearchaeota archaeon]